MVRRVARAPARISPYTPRLRCADRKSLLLGTALASTLLISAVLTPTPASAVACIQPPSPNPINTNTLADNQPIICVNTEPRTNPAGNAINLTTNGAGSFIDLHNSGVLSATNNNFFMSGIFAYTQGLNSPIAIENVAAITATNNGPGNAFAIRALAERGSSPISIVNSGELHAYSLNAEAAGIDAVTAPILGYSNNPITIVNSGTITLTGFAADGIRAFAVGANSLVHIENTGEIVATGDQFAGGIPRGGGRCRLRHQRRKPR
jgi:autotransporter family porin